MAYNKRNHLKSTEHIKKIYLEVKEYDVPDSHIVRVIFPKHNIFISYRKWMNIKNAKLQQPSPQLKLFA